MNSLLFDQSHFPSLDSEISSIPAWCLTPGEGRIIHRFFDTCPISPSGRYLAAFRFPFEDRLNEPGEEGEVVLIDLLGGSERVVARTSGWEFQLGANLNWGKDDHSLLFNDVDTPSWQPLLVKLDPLRGTSERIPGGVYHVSPDGRFAAAASLEKMARTQRGYGVSIPPERIGRNIGTPNDDGLFITDLETGERRLVLSLAEAVRAIPELDEKHLTDWEIYGFHTKWSPTGDRILFTIRRFPVEGPHRFDLLHAWHPEQALRFDVLTLRPDGSDLKNAVPAARWEAGGHHINWFPNGRKLSMNLGGFGDNLRFLSVNLDGSDLTPLLSDTIGSGHPTLHPNGRLLLTDAYAHEPVAFADGSVPLRALDLSTGREECLLRIGAVTNPLPHRALRVDPHPAWDREWRHFVFNGVLPGENTRRVFLADPHSILDRE